MIVKTIQRHSICLSQARTFVPTVIGRGEHPTKYFNRQRTTKSGPRPSPETESSTGIQSTSEPRIRKHFAKEKPKPKNSFKYPFELKDEQPSETFGDREIIRRVPDPSIDQNSAFYLLLDPRYEIGGNLKRTNQASDREREDAGGRRPMWGKSSIPVRFSKDPETVHHLPNIWLRDHCRCKKCVNRDTSQRAFDTFQISPEVMPSQVVTQKEGLRVTWMNDGISDGHVSLYPWEWLVKNISTKRWYEEQQKISDLKTFWGRDISSSPPSVHYDEIMADDEGVGKWTAKIQNFGFCYVDGCPVSPDETKKLLERIAFVRVTHYGGFYDFTSDLTMKDTAYTSLALGAHTDTTYFTDPAGLQMFHLLSHTEGTGGVSLLVDGFHAAKRLAIEDPHSYQVLLETPIAWHASGNKGITITPAQRFPVLVCMGRSKSLLQVRWNNDDRGLVPLFDTEHRSITGSRWYAAARKFDEILKREEMQYWAQLEPGRPLIFDNWRVLHGRSSFTGKRRICGGYINHDDYISRWRNTNFSRKEALSQIL